MAQSNANDVLLDVHDDTNNLLKVGLQAGTNNVGDVDVLSIAAGDNNIGNVDIVTLPVKTYVTKTVTIANGASLSDATSDNTGYRLIALQMPAAWTSASITFQGSLDNVTFGIWYGAYNSGAITVASGGAAADNYVQIDYPDTTAPPYLKVRSGTGGSPVNQGAERSIKLIFEPLR